MIPTGRLANGGHDEHRDDFEESEETGAEIKLRAVEHTDLPEPSATAAMDMPADSVRSISFFSRGTHPTHAARITTLVSATALFE